MPLGAAEEDEETMLLGAAEEDEETMPLGAAEEDEETADFGRSGRVLKIEGRGEGLAILVDDMSLIVSGFGVVNTSALTYVATSFRVLENETPLGDPGADMFITREIFLGTCKCTTCGRTSWLNSSARSPW